MCKNCSSAEICIHGRASNETICEFACLTYFRLDSMAHGHGERAEIYYFLLAFCMRNAPQTIAIFDAMCKINTYSLLYRFIVESVVGCICSLFMCVWVCVCGICIYSLKLSRLACVSFVGGDTNLSVCVCATAYWAHCTKAWLLFV